MAERALVVGCGVSGLTSAIALAEAGFQVTIWTRDLPPRTTSNVAGAIWYPYKVEPLERVAAWARRTYVALAAIARDPRSGVRLEHGVEWLPPGLGERGAEFRAAAPDLRELAPHLVPEHFERGFEFSAPVCEMPLYLAYLLERFERAGGSLQQRTLASLDEALAAAPLVVNCVGLAARELLGDPHMRPIRGQLVRVERCDVQRFVLDDYDPRGVTYVIPRSNDCVLGGTTEEGREDLTPEEGATRAILERCRELAPGLSEARVLSVAVGLRPGRTQVRLEGERRGGSRIVHNYGHGGAGVTLSWGCAQDVVALARDPNAFAQ